MEGPLLIIAIIILIALFNQWVFNTRRKRRRNYYRNVYLKSDDWRRKRYVVWIFYGNACESGRDDPGIARGVVRGGTGTGRAAGYGAGPGTERACGILNIPKVLGTSHVIALESSMVSPEFTRYGETP